MAPIRPLTVVPLACLLLAACSDDPTTAFAGPASSRSPDAATALLVRQLAAERGIVPLRREAPVRPALVRLGRALTFDPVLSGNRNIACSTCHLPSFGTGDGRSLSVGEGATDFGPGRTHPGGIFIPRNAPSLFNLAAMRHLFWDGRVQVDPAGNLSTPAGPQLTPEMREVFEFGAISALAMFPVTNREEMRGAPGSNEVADLPDADLTGIWAALMGRLGGIPEYRSMFEAAYPGTPFEEMTFAHASNAIAGFVVEKLTFVDTPWDRFLAGSNRALSPAQLRGAQTFLALKCSVCHNGATFSDDDFHNVAVAQFGPGQGNGESLRDDFGRMNVTGDAADRYRFRTTPLRNVELTGPYGHTGAIASLRGFIEHYSESHLKLRAYDGAELEPALRPTLLDNAEEILAHRDTLLDGVVLSDQIVDELTAYMSALTDDAARDLARITPRTVPSGLPVDRP